MDKRLRNVAPTFTPRRRFPLGLKCCEMEQRIGNILCANRTATDNHSARTMPQWVFLNLGLKSKHYLASVFRESKQSSLFFVSEVAKQHNEAFQSDNSEYLRVRTEVFKMVNKTQKCCWYLRDFSNNGNLLLQQPYQPNK